jgi:hypothetical protein
VNKERVPHPSGQVALIHPSVWKEDSLKFACNGFSEAATVFRHAPMWGKRHSRYTAPDGSPSIRTPSGVFSCCPLVTCSNGREDCCLIHEALRREILGNLRFAVDFFWVLFSALLLTPSHLSTCKVNSRHFAYISFSEVSVLSLPKAIDPGFDA